MHELGIIVYISKTLKQVAEENNVDEIASVTLEIGEVSGVVNEYLIDAWNYFRKKEQVLLNTEMKIVTIPAITYCENCHQKYETVKYGKECPHCHSGDTYLFEGNECNIKEIEVLR